MKVAHVINVPAAPQFVLVRPDNHLGYVYATLITGRYFDLGNLIA